MPSITFSLTDLNKLLGKRLDKDKLEKLLTLAKAELNSLENDTADVTFNDTNCPYLWSVEGIARLFKGILHVETGLYSIKTNRTTLKVIIDRKVSKIRPFISCFIAKGKKVDEYLLKQLIQLQEKLADSFGRHRKKLSVGLYPAKKIEFPVFYKTTNPCTSFVPLDHHEEMTITEILKTHSKGKEFAHILENQTECPILIDSKKNILSLAPIINSNNVGKLETGDDELFFDATGTDEESVSLAANIFASALSDRGFKIESLIMEYPSKKVISPTLAVKRIKINNDLFKTKLGYNFTEKELKPLFEKMRYGYSKGIAVVPFYRNDIMHPVDIAEDIAISYGYENIEELPLTTYTTGKTLPSTEITDTSRMLLIGLGYQEILNPILSNKDILFDKLNIPETFFPCVEIENIMSQTYSCVRSWLLPILIETLSKNRHLDYPQKIFEEGLVTKRKEDQTTDENHIAAVSAHTVASFTEIKQATTFLLESLGIDFTIEETELSCFIPGRSATIMINKKQAGFLGEIHPKVLSNFGILVPVAGCEINLNSILKYKENKTTKK